MEFVQAFYNFNAFNIFHRPRFQAWEKKNPKKSHRLQTGKFKYRLYFLFENLSQTPVANRRQTPTSADENPQPFEHIERIEPFEHYKPLKPQKLLVRVENIQPLQPLLNLYLLLI